MTTSNAAAALSGTPAAPAAASGTPAPDAGNAPAGTPAGTPAPSGDQWYAGIQNQEVRTWVEAKGFKDPLSAAESAYNLEKLMGFDRAGKTVVLPDENSPPEARQAFLQKLGVPEKPEGYGFKVPDGADDSFAKSAAQWLHEAGVPAKAGEALFQKWNEYAQTMQTQQQTAFAAQSERDMATLKTEWGQAYDQNVELGRRAALQFIPGSGEERAATLNKLEQALGTSGLLKFMANIGQGLGEHKMVQGGGSGVMTPAQASQRIAELKSNADWTKAYLSGDQAKAKELSDLIMMANPSGG